MDPEMFLQVCTQGSFESLSTLSTVSLHVIFYCWQLKLKSLFSCNQAVSQPLNWGWNLQSGRHMLIFVPSAKQPGPPQCSATIVSRPLWGKTKKKTVLSIFTPTPSPAWTFVSLSLKAPPVELCPPKKPDVYGRPSELEAAPWAGGGQTFKHGRSRVSLQLLQKLLPVPPGSISYWYKKGFH